MSELSLTLVMKNYDYLISLVGGEIAMTSVRLTLIRDTPNALARTFVDVAVDGGEASFARYLLRISQGDRSLIGIPFFAVRGFRHRCFYIRRGTSFKGLKDLEGKKVGTNEWPATGNVWSRALLREEGVRCDRIRWYVGPINAAGTGRTQDSLPRYAQAARPGHSLRDLLLAGEVDALMCPDIPEGVYEPNGPIVRLFPNYREVEKDYYKRTGLYPGFHIVCLRRSLYKRNASLPGKIYSALVECKDRWQATLQQIPEMGTPWLLNDLEETRAVIGPDWNPSGVRANEKMISTMCDELASQGIVRQQINPQEVFAEFEEAAGQK